MSLTHKTRERSTPGYSAGGASHASSASNLMGSTAQKETPRMGDPLQRGGSSDPKVNLSSSLRHKKREAGSLKAVVKDGNPTIRIKYRRGQKVSGL